jgi:hypothetical protein
MNCEDIYLHLKSQSKWSFSNKNKLNSKATCKKEKINTLNPGICYGLDLISAVRARVGSTIMDESISFMDGAFVDYVEH